MRKPATDVQGVTPTGRHRPDRPVVRTPRSIRTREPRRPAGPMRVALLIPVAALLVLVSGALGSFRWMLVPSLVLGAAGGIWLIVTCLGSPCGVCQPMVTTCAHGGGVSGV